MLLRYQTVLHKLHALRFAEDFVGSSAARNRNKDVFLSLILQSPAIVCFPCAVPNGNVVHRLPAPCNTEKR